MSRLDDIKAVAYEVDAYANSVDDVRYLLGVIEETRATLQKLLRFAMLKGGFHSDVPEIDAALTLLNDAQSQSEVAK